MWPEFQFVGFESCTFSSEIWRIYFWLPLLPVLATGDLSYFISFFSDVFKLCLFVILICFCIFFFFPLAWVISIGLGMMFLFAPVTSALCERIGCRIVAFLGGLLGILGFVLSSFVSDVYRLYVTFGVLWGVGASMSYLPTLRSLPYWFSRWARFIKFILKGKTMKMVKRL